MGHRSVTSGHGASDARVQRGSQQLLVVAVTVLLSHVCVSALSEDGSRGVRGTRGAGGADRPCARLQSGWVRGVRRSAGNHTFASFLGVPYARQPVGELRFQELQPVEPWEHFYDATEEGPICPQKDIFYGRIMQPKNTAFTEACIHANVHVPLHALPSGHGRPPRGLQPPYQVVEDEESPRGPGLPILVFVHGGGFAFGSGDTDLHGPEYLVNHDVIVITFNYRLNVFGFLSLNNSFIPGNNGLRDMVTLLRWVRANARAFGGNPDDVTLAGHSAGAASTHLLMLSKAATGLFRRAMIMSGAAIPTFYTTAPAYAQFASKIFLDGLGVNSTDPEEVHQQLVEMPLEKIMQVHNAMLDQFGLGVFYPVVESTAYPNFTTILDEDPESLLVSGCGKDIPLIVGFTNAECYGFLQRFEQMDIISRIKENPLILTPPHLIYTRPIELSLDIARTIQDRYFQGDMVMDQYVKYCTESYFIYPAMRASLIRAAVGGAPVYLYEFSYDSEFSIKKEVDKTDYKGAGHLEDVTYVFRVNSILGPEGKTKLRRSDEDMKNWMVHFVTNFMKFSDPATDGQPRYATLWPPVTKRDMRYQDISTPSYRVLEFNRYQLEMLRFFDSLQNRTS